VAGAFQHCHCLTVHNLTVILGQSLSSLYITLICYLTPVTGTSLHCRWATTTGPGTLPCCERCTSAPPLSCCTTRQRVTRLCWCPTRVLHHAVLHLSLRVVCSVGPLNHPLDVSLCRYRG
jgi:hypothetical protein